MNFNLSIIFEQWTEIDKLYQRNQTLSKNNHREVSPMVSRLSVCLMSTDSHH